MRNAEFWPILASIILFGCTTPVGSPAATAAATARANIADAAGRSVATAIVTEGDGLRVAIEANGLSEGSYGVHIHAVGRCDLPSFTSAGPHWNPRSRQHGSLNPQGAHAGDMPNLSVGADGSGRIAFTVPDLALRGNDGLIDADGAAVVIHAGPDDYRTDPSGNSGARIACGVLG